jgi:hypothetical protein
MYAASHVRSRLIGVLWAYKHGRDSNRISVCNALWENYTLTYIPFGKCVKMATLKSCDVVEYIKMNICSELHVVNCRLMLHNLLIDKDMLDHIVAKYVDVYNKQVKLCTAQRC